MWSIPQQSSAIAATLSPVRSLESNRLESSVAQESPAGTPFLLDPALDYDVALNAFFRSADMLRCAPLTQVGYARDLAAFLTFLWSARGGRGWREATTPDHLAYLVWRRFDEAGPHLAPATWNRELAAVNRFYEWQFQSGNLAANPIPQQTSRRSHSSWASYGGAEPGQRPATYSHAGGRERVQWFPAEAYRRWRDVGVRGYTAAGLPDPAFRGRWASRNAVFCDLLVRTGMRLSEQAGLTVFEVPTDRGLGGYTSFRLSAALAKGGSSRVVYVPDSVTTDLVGYATADREGVVARAQASGRYRQLEHAIWWLTRLARSCAFQADAGCRWPPCLGRNDSGYW